MKHYMDYGAFNDDPAPLVEVDTARRTQVYSLTHTGEGQSLPFLDKAYISFTYGGKKIEDFGLIATTTGGGLNRQAPPAHEDFTTDNRVLHGQYYWGSHYQARQLGLDLATDGITQRQLDEFKYWFAAGQIRELILAEHPNRAIMARIADAPEISLIPFKTQEEVMINGVPHTVETAEYKGSIHLNFVMDDPFWYAKKNYLGTIKKNEDTGHYQLVNQWIDANGNITDQLDADGLKTVIEDRIPTGEMINTNVSVGDGKTLISQYPGALIGTETSRHPLVDFAIVGGQQPRHSDNNKIFSFGKEDFVRGIFLTDDVKFTNKFDASERFSFPATDLVSPDKDMLSFSLKKWYFVKKDSQITIKSAQEKYPYNGDFRYFFPNIEIFFTNNQDLLIRQYYYFEGDQLYGIQEEKTIEEAHNWQASGTKDPMSFTAPCDGWIMLSVISSRIPDDDSIEGYYPLECFEKISLTDNEEGLTIDQNTPLQYFYSGSAPSYPQLSFSVPIHFNEKGYIDVFNNEYLQQESNYNTLSLEGEFKHELRFTTPSIFGSYNYAIKLLRADKGGLRNLDFSAAFQLLRETIPHFGVRSWVINCINLYKNNFNNGEKETKKKTTVDQQVCEAVLGYMPYFFATENDIDIEQDIAEKVQQFDNKDESISIELEGVIKFGGNEIQEDVRGNTCYCLVGDYVQIHTKEVTNVMLIAWRETVDGITRNIDLKNDELWQAIDSEDYTKGIKTRRALNSLDLTEFRNSHSYDCLISNLFTASQSKNAIKVQMRANTITLQNPSFTITHTAANQQTEQSNSNEKLNNYYTFIGDTIECKIQIPNKPRGGDYSWKKSTDSTTWEPIEPNDQYDIKITNLSSSSVSLSLTIKQLDINNNGEEYKVVVWGNNGTSTEYSFGTIKMLYLKQGVVSIYSKSRVNQDSLYPVRPLYELKFPLDDSETTLPFEILSYSKVKMKISATPSYLNLDSSNYKINIDFKVKRPSAKEEVGSSTFLADHDSNNSNEVTRQIASTIDDTENHQKTYEFYFDNKNDTVNYAITNYSYCLIPTWHEDGIQKNGYSIMKFIITLKYKGYDIHQITQINNWKDEVLGDPPIPPGYSIKFTDSEQSVLFYQKGNEKIYYCNTDNISKLQINLTSSTNNHPYKWQYKINQWKNWEQESGNIVIGNDAKQFSPGYQFQFYAYFEDYLNEHPDEEQNFQGKTIKIYYIPELSFNLTLKSQQFNFITLSDLKEKEEDFYDTAIQISFDDIDSSYDFNGYMNCYYTTDKNTLKQISPAWFSNPSPDAFSWSQFREQGVTYYGLWSIQPIFFDNKQTVNASETLTIIIQDIYNKRIESSVTIKVITDKFGQETMTVSPTTDSYEQKIIIQKSIVENQLLTQGKIEKGKIYYGDRKKTNTKNQTAQMIIAKGNKNELDAGLQTAWNIIVNGYTNMQDYKYYIFYWDSSSDDGYFYCFGKPIEISNQSISKTIEAEWSDSNTKLTITGKPLFNLNKDYQLLDQSIECTLPVSYSYRKLLWRKDLGRFQGTTDSGWIQSTESKVISLPGSITLKNNTSSLEKSWTISTARIPYTEYQISLTQEEVDLGLKKLSNNVKALYEFNYYLTENAQEPCATLNQTINSFPYQVKSTTDKLKHKLEFQLEYSLLASKLSLSDFQTIIKNLDNMKLVLQFKSLYQYSFLQNDIDLNSSAGTQLMYAARGTTLLNNQNNTNLISQKPKFSFDMKLGQYLMNIHYNTITKPNGKLKSITETPNHIIYLSSLMDDDKKDNIYEEPIGNMILYNDFIFEEQNHFDLQTGKLQAWREDDPLLCHKLIYDGDIPLENFILMYKNLYL